MAWFLFGLHVSKSSLKTNVRYWRWFQPVNATTERSQPPSKLISSSNLFCRGDSCVLGFRVEVRPLTHRAEQAPCPFWGKADIAKDAPLVDIAKLAAASIRN